MSDHATISLEPLSERSYVYDRFGNLLGTLVNEQNRVQVPLDQISEPMVETVIAVEDEHFYSHNGVNLRSIVRAFSANLEQGGVQQGGSTITQQLVKNSIVGTDQNLSRKMREAVLAVELEKEMTKKEILERYLNTIYFGNGAYGVQAAAELYFNANAAGPRLVTGRAARRADPQPEPVRPVHAPRGGQRAAGARARRPGPPEAREPPGRRPPRRRARCRRSPNIPKPPNDYFVEQVKQQLLDDERLGRHADGPLQRGVRRRPAHLHHLRSVPAVPGPPGPPGLDWSSCRATAGTARSTSASTPPATLVFGTLAMAGVEPSTGAVRMLVGGPGFDRYKFDLARRRGSRQPGSSFKTFVLTEAMEQGYSPNDLIDGHGPCDDIPGYPVDEPPGELRRQPWWHLAPSPARR